ncbi:MAG: hypothetical protein WC586_12470 [Methanoregula sp.]
MKSLLNRWLVVAVLVILFVGMTATLLIALQEDQHMRDQLLTKARLADVGIDPHRVAALSGTLSDLSSSDYHVLAL